MHTHVDFFKNTDVEVHFRPWISHNLIRNYRLQKLSRKFGKKSFVVNKNNNLIVPAHLFNVVHVLHHIYWYFLVEGARLDPAIPATFRARSLLWSWVLPQVLLSMMPAPASIASSICPASPCPPTVSSWPSCCGSTPASRSL